MKKYKAIIFDMNGVIVDDEQLHVKADINTVKHFNLRVPLKEWPKFKGWKSQEIFSYLVRKYGDKKIDIAEMVDYKIKEYFRISKYEVKQIADAINFLKFSKKIFPQIALVTSSVKIYQKFVFKKFNLKNYFDVIVTAEEFSKGKPDPESYLKALEKLKLNPGDCLVIEDSINGVISAKKAGCKVIAITTSFKKNSLQAAGADFIFSGFKQAINHKNLWL